MKIRLLIICLFFFSSQVFAWTKEEIKLFYSGCAEYETNWTYKEQHAYCDCYTKSITKKFTVNQVKKMTFNGTFEKNKDFLRTVKYCVKQHINY